MAGLSSNWKKLQAKLKAESPSKPSLKRKSTAPPTTTSPPPKKSKLSDKQPYPTKRPRPSSKTQMGGVHSSENGPGNTASPSLALWAEDNGVSAEALAEAYNLGTKDNSMMLTSQKDKVNNGLIEGIEIGKYLAIDCEMVGVGPGGHESALARVSVVDFHGKQIYDSYVKPQEKVTNWRTAVSGISQKSMRFARDFDEVQRDIDKLLQTRILIGHDIKHDLEALKLSHPARDIRDTAKYPAFRQYGNGRKPALRLLAQQLLSIEIQDGAHSSIEDARVTMLLFRKHKSGFDVDHSNRYAPKTNGGGTPKGGKSKKKRKG